MFNPTCLVAGYSSEKQQLRCSTNSDKNHHWEEYQTKSSIILKSLVIIRAYIFEAWCILMSEHTHQEISLYVASCLHEQVMANIELR